MKISDFGISYRHQEKANTTITAGRSSWGYGAPEAVGASEFDLEYPHASAADMWSLGAVIYKMITNDLVFSKIHDLMRFTTGETELPVAALEHQNVSEAGKNLILKLLKTNPADRLTAASASQHPWITTTIEAGQWSRRSNQQLQPKTLQPPFNRPYEAPSYETCDEDNLDDTRLPRLPQDSARVLDSFPEDMAPPKEESPIASVASASESTWGAGLSTSGSQRAEVQIPSEQPPSSSKSPISLPKQGMPSLGPGETQATSQKPLECKLKLHELYDRMSSVTKNSKSPRLRRSH